MKKVAKKSGKVVTKKKTPGKKQLLSVSGDSCFWVNNGPILSNLKDLEGALKGMTEEQWKHHVDKHKNDFAAWVKGVLSEETCAKSLMKCKTKGEAVKVVTTAVKKY